MLSTDLALNQNLVVFEDLNELLSTLDEYIDLHRSAIQRYGDRLGDLLRSGNGPAEKPGERQVEKETGQKRGRDDKEPWITHRLDKSGDVNLRVANTSVVLSSVAEKNTLFRIIDSLKERVQMLENARAIISELPSRGQRADQRFLVAFGEGIPRQVIPTNESYANQNKYRYSGQFELEIMDEAQAVA